MGAGEGGFGFGAGECGVEDFAAEGLGAGRDEDKGFVVLAALGFVDGEAISVLEGGEGEGGNLAGGEEDGVVDFEVGSVFADEQAEVAVEELEVGGIAGDHDGGDEGGAGGHLFEELVEEMSVDGVDSEGALAHAREDAELAEMGEGLLRG